MMKRIKHRIYRLLEVSGEPWSPSWWVDIGLIILIVSNVLALILETVPRLGETHRAAFQALETLSIVIFTAEYLLRLWVCTENPAYRHPVRGRIRYLCSAGAMVDLISIMPWYLSMITWDLRVVRLLRMFRLIRLLKLARYVRAVRMITEVLRQKRDQLAVSLMMLCFLLLIASSMMYYAEHPAQPDKFGSIPETMWWGIATLTTVGYGDVYPVTPVGKLLGGVIAVLGIGLFGLPAGILASGFSEAIASSQQRHCPHCGQPLP